MKNTIIAIMMMLPFLGVAQVQETKSEPALKRNIFKVEFLSPLTGNTTLGYERHIKNGISIDAQVGVIGAGVSMLNRDVAGIFVKAGPKFYPGKDFTLEGMKMVHPMRGFYINPHINFSTFKRTNWENKEKHHTGLGIIMEAGYQVISSNFFVMEFGAGLGYNLDISNSEAIGYYSHTGGPAEFPLAFELTWNIGILTK